MLRKRKKRKGIRRRCNFCGTTYYARVRNAVYCPYCHNPWRKRRVKNKFLLTRLRRRLRR